uniref:Uncharacterized protein n=1 Tax=Vespula pensylvanica TaxID=30213 RepID=A0A834KMG7_VESPE|nr:hypothetical protein H0235_013256 [Vespula pensylvanica]
MREDCRRIADPGSSRRNAAPGRPVTSPATTIPRTTRSRRALADRTKAQAHPQTQLQVQILLGTKKSSVWTPLNSDQLRISMGIVGGWAIGVNKKGEYPSSSFLSSPFFGYLLRSHRMPRSRGQAKAD